MNTVMTLSGPIIGEYFVDQLGKCWFLKDTAPWKLLGRQVSR
jgi:hypothetical protein